MADDIVWIQRCFCNNIERPVTLEPRMFLNIKMLKFILVVSLELSNSRLLESSRIGFKTIEMLQSY
jgi:hypothetical protein